MHAKYRQCAFNREAQLPAADSTVHPDTAAPIAAAAVLLIGPSKLKKKKEFPIACTTPLMSEEVWHTPDVCVCIDSVGITTLSVPVNRRVCQHDICVCLWLNT